MKRLGRVLLWVLAAGVLLQLYFVARIALMAVVDPQSTTFQRSEMARVALAGRFAWGQHWVPYEQISDHLKRAVIASEDSGFVDHDGVEWDALQQARERNAAAEARTAAQRQRAEERLQQVQQRARQRVAELERRGRPVSDELRARAEGASAPVVPGARIVGGSTITQQLAKNLLLSGERTLLRKGQELLLTYYLEWMLGKRRILEIYLNNVEWGEGIFGAEAAARYYFGKPASQLSAGEGARLAVMLPRPKYFEQHRGELGGRAATIAARARSAQLP